MALPASGPISLSMIQAEFGGANPISLSEYYKNGTYVTATDYAPNVPTSGTISLSNFYSSRKLSLTTLTYTSDGSFVLPAGFLGNLIVNYMLGGGGGGGGTDVGPGFPGYAGRSITGGNIPAAVGQTVTISIGGGGGGGTSLVFAPAPGGAGGASSLGYNGAVGGASGSAGASGSGGGGGAATVLLLDGAALAVAGGGGGGGGDGQFQDGRPNNDNPGTSGSISGTPGENKEDQGSIDDGGGGGGGAGGQNGGVGGLVFPGDNGGYSGENGASVIPVGGVAGAGNNGGGSTASGGGGSVTVSYYA